MKLSYSVIVFIGALLGTFVDLSYSQMSPMYNRRLFDMPSFRYMVPFHNDKSAALFPSKMANQKFVPLLKKSDANWEDLGWAWGKRSSGGADPASDDVPLERSSRSMKQVKKNPDWHDLGWAWGRK